VVLPVAGEMCDASVDARRICCFKSFVVGDVDGNLKLEIDFGSGIRRCEMDDV